MDIEVLTRFFGWCTVVNVGMLVFISVVGILLADFSYRMNHKFFSISRETFNIVMVSFVGLYKLLVMIFVVVPYVALLIIG